MNMHDREGKRVLPAIALLAMSLAPALASADESCPIPIEDVKAAIEAFASKASSEESNVRNDLKATTGSSYTDFYFEHFTRVNGTGDDTTKFVTNALDLIKIAGALPEGQVKKSPPPSATISMRNDIELSQSA